MSGWSMLHLTIFFFFLHPRRWKFLIFVGLLPGETYLMCIHWNFELDIVSIALRRRYIWEILMGLGEKVDWICIFFWLEKDVFMFWLIGIASSGMISEVSLVVFLWDYIYFVRWYFIGKISRYWRLFETRNSIHG